MVAAYAAGLVALGLRLGLYRAMAGQGPLTSNEVAERAGLHERWVLEWLHAQSAARVVDYAGNGRFEVTDAVAALLADESSILYLGGSFTTLPNHLSLLPRFDEAFHTGLGLAFDDRGLESAQDSEVLMGNWYRQVLISTALPQLEGVISRLHQGAVVADVGCGSSRWPRRSRPPPSTAMTCRSMPSRGRSRIALRWVPEMSPSTVSMQTRSLMDPCSTW